VQASADNMKKFLIALGVVLAVLIGGWCWIWWGMGFRQVYLGDTAAVFAGDLADFVTAHNGNLPADWSTFEAWQTKRDGETRWEARATSERVQLLQPPYATTNDIPVYVRVIDPDIKGLEDSINQRVYVAREVLRHQAQGGQPTSAPSSLPEAGSKR
jgi:hypothetical protein